MPQRIHQQYKNEARAVALFAAEKYRLMVGLARRFNDDPVIQSAEEKRIAYAEAALVCATSMSGVVILSDAQASLMTVAFVGYIDELNRRMQSLYNANHGEQARQIEHALAGVYGAQRSLAANGELVAPGEVVPINGEE